MSYEDLEAIRDWGINHNALARELAQSSQPSAEDLINEVLKGGFI